MHKDQLLDLKGLYQKRIQGLRDIYEKELLIQTEEGQKRMREKQLSQESLSSYLQHNDSRKQIENMHLVLKDMYSIE